MNGRDQLFACWVFLCWSCLLAGLRTIGVVASTSCPRDIVVTNATRCGTRLFWLELNGTTESTNTFPLGNSSVTLYNSTYSCTFSIAIEPLVLVNGSNVICGDYGSCTTSAPYTCTCDTGSDSEFCCGTLVVNGSDVACGGHGECITTGVCECAPGYGGPWCCPLVAIGSNTQHACGNSGCCMMDGSCLCDDGFEGVACNITSGVLFTRVATVAKTAVIVIGAVVGAAGIVVVLTAALTSSAIAGATATASATVASTPLGFLTVAGRYQQRRRLTGSNASNENNGILRGNRSD